MTEIITTILTGSIAFMLAVAPALAASTDDPGIQKRGTIQERRIDPGFKSSQQPPKEAGNLEAREAKIKQDEERVKSDDQLTKKERVKLKKEQNKASKKSHGKKHNEKKIDVGEGK
jgi:hypothetical protein